MQKVQKVESVIIQSDCKATSKKRTVLSCIFTHNGKVQKGGSINAQNEYETSEKRTDKKKTNLFCVFCKIFNSQESKIKIIQKNFYEIIIIKRFLGKATGHNDHYMIHMGSQRPAIDSN